MLGCQLPRPKTHKPRQIHGVRAKLSAANPSFLPMIDFDGFEEERRRAGGVGAETVGFKRVSAIYLPSRQVSIATEHEPTHGLRH